MMTTINKVYCSPKTDEEWMSLLGYISSDTCNRCVYYGIWMLSQDIFHELFKEWVDSEKQEMKIPTCDRLDNTKGYTFDNIRIVTLQENLKQAGLDTILGVDKRTCTPIKQYSMQGQFIKEHHSISAAARSINGDSNAISKCKNGKQKFHKGFIWKL